MVLAGLYIQAGSQAEFRDEIGLQVGLCGQVGLQAVCHSLLSEVTGGLPGLGGPAAVSDSWWSWRLYFTVRQGQSGLPGQKWIAGYALQLGGVIGWDT